MTALGWAALALLGALVGGGRRLPARAAGLAAGQRLGPVVAASARRPPPVPPQLAAGGTVTEVVVAGLLVAGAAVVAVTAAPPWGVAALAAGAAGRSGVRGAVRGRRAAAARAELRTAVGALAAELAAGGRPAGALAAAAAAGPIHEALFARAAGVAAEGGDAAAVLQAVPGARGLGCAWRLGEQAGAGLAGVLGRVAADLEQEEQRRRAVAVALAGPQASAAVLAGLPLLGLALGAAMGAHPLSFLFGSPAGSAVGAAGVLLDVGGLVWLRRLLGRAAGP